MNKHKFLYILFTVIMIVSLVGGHSTATAMPASPVDETKVPHYFGPYPNWANSPFTLPDATVAIDPPSDPLGQTATAVATVGANGAVTGITVTSPGSGYTANPNVTINGSGTGATAQATAIFSGMVNSILLDTPGAGYTTPSVNITGGGGTGAMATAYGGVDAVNFVAPNFVGNGYTMPTVEFDLPDDPNGVQAQGHAECVGDPVGGPYCVPAIQGDSVTIAAVVVDNPGSGYSFAPGIAIHNGTLFDPIALNPGGFLASAATSLSIQSVVVNAFGAGYTSIPSVSIDDVNGFVTQATAHATVDTGGVTSIVVVTPGSGYITGGGIRKFVDTLPGLGSGGANNLGQYIPVAVPDQTTFPGADYYEIAVVEYLQQMHSDLPPTRLRGYVQLATNVVPGIGFPLTYLGGSPILRSDGLTQFLAVDQPRYLGPTIIAAKDRAVRITFYNLLPTGTAGDLFLPVDTTLMGSGPAEMADPYDPVPTAGGDVMDAARNPMCDDPMMRSMCYTQNRATLHLHGGNVPWISDGTPHQWITPAGESTMWPEGVSVQSVPDMVGASLPAGVPDCSGANDGCQTFYYTNQQSARLMFYHDHSWGITRLNVYAGEAAGYVITDPTEQALFGVNGQYASLGEGTPLVIQDRTFVPRPEQLAWQDPTWDAARWGGYGNFWYHHVYMPAQNPGDPGGMSAYGRWMYGPWFWPPSGDAKYGPIANPYYNMDPATGWTTPLAVPCSLDNPATWQYQTDPFCEPQLIPGTPNLSVGMEQFNDTPIVNGVAYPTVTLEPKAYRFRILNAANDRFFNFQWYVADATTASTGLNGLGQVIGGTEVALKASEVAAAQLDPVVFPTPDLALSPAGPDWIQFGSEGGFLPKPVVVDGQQVTTWITDPTRFDVGNVDLHSLLLAPAERADVIVDFSQFAGKTLILYNDAPAAFPARVPSYDYYTGAPDLRPVGAPNILPGYGPNTRTVMQVKIAGTPASAFSVSTFQNKFSHKADGSGVFEAGQHPIIVGQSAYNSAYGTSFASAGNCETNQTIKCDGYARINQQGGDLFTFDTLRMKSNGTYPAGYGKVSIPLQPKAIHDEMNSTNFDEFGRMQATLGVEVVPATPGLQNVVLSPYVFPTTELIDTTLLPKADVKVTPIATASDGTQIWKITHNGVDTHPIHFHATDVQILNRVTWDNIIIPPDATELGWKETIRVSPLEDTIVAMRPVIPVLPFDFPNSIRLLSPMMTEGTAIDLSSVKDPLNLGMTAFNPDGEPIDVWNHYVNFGAEYVYHCHILSHEEMDMMHAVLYAFPPVAPSGLVVTTAPTGDYRNVDLAWNDNSRSETGWEIQRSSDGGLTWATLAMIQPEALMPGAGSSIGGTVTYSDLIAGTTAASLSYRVRAINVVGDTWNYSMPAINQIVSGGFPTITTYSAFSEVQTVGIPPESPTNLTATYLPSTNGNTWLPPRVSLTWTDNANNEAGFDVLRSTDGGVSFSTVGTVAALAGTGSVSFTDMGVAGSTTFIYQVRAWNSGGASLSNTASVTTPAYPPAPSPLNVTCVVWNTSSARCTLTWIDVAGNGGYVVQRATNAAFTTGVNSVQINQADATTYTTGNLTRNTDYYFRIRSTNGNGGSPWTNATPFPVHTP